MDTQFSIKNAIADLYTKAKEQREYHLAKVRELDEILNTKTVFSITRKANWTPERRAHHSQLMRQRWANHKGDNQ